MRAAFNRHAWVTTAGTDGQPHVPVNQSVAAHHHEHAPSTHWYGSPITGASAGPTTYCVESYAVPGVLNAVSGEIEDSPVKSGRYSRTAGPPWIRRDDGASSSQNRRPVQLSTS